MVNLQVFQHGDEVREDPIHTKCYRLNGLTHAALNRTNAARRMYAQSAKNRQIALASVAKHLIWPSLEDYANAFSKYSQLPSLPKAFLFNVHERETLVFDIIGNLLMPSSIENICWRVAKRFGIGPLTPANTESLLNACNIDLNYVA